LLHKEDSLERLTQKLLANQQINLGASENLGFPGRYLATSLLFSTTRVTSNAEKHGLLQNSMLRKLLQNQN